MFFGRFPSLCTRWAARCNRCRRLVSRVRQASTPAPVPGAATGGGKVDHAKIHTKDVRGGERRAIRDLYDDQQKPLAIVTHDEMTLPGLMFHEARAMGHPNRKRVEHPPSQRQQTH